ncbi:MAG: S41 family peptidase [Bacteroidota bacterium]
MRKGLTIILFTLIFIACNDDADIRVSKYYEINDFIWHAMNTYYYWVDDVDDLSNAKTVSNRAYNSFLTKTHDPEDFFNGLLYKKDVVDRFSWIVDDYDELEDSFQGISKSFGYDFGLIFMPDGFNIYGYVRYVIPDSPADHAGLKRGDLFRAVNNTPLNYDNYLPLLTGNDSYTLTLATKINDVVLSSDLKVSMDAIELIENPIFLSKVLQAGDKQVGYLLYNQFINNDEYHEQLNQVFGDFKSQGISELILDLRYNRGGSLLTARILSSLVYSAGNSNDLLGTIVCNRKLSYLNSDILFLPEIPIHNADGDVVSSIPMERLNINRIYILTSGATASASEFVIVGLQPYMDVKVIGTKTVGKNVGSSTLYDSNDFSASSFRNPDHKYALQPIIFQLANSVGFKDYTSGLQPDIWVNEYNYLEEGLFPLGDPEEPLLATALADISGESARVTYDSYIGLDIMDGPKDGVELLKSTIVDDRDISY